MACPRVSVAPARPTDPTTPITVRRAVTAAAILRRILPPALAPWSQTSLPIVRSNLQGARAARRTRRPIDVRAQEGIWTAHDKGGTSLGEVEYRRRQQLAVRPQPLE